MKKSELAAALASAMRFNQTLGDRFDELVCKRLGITITEFRCMDIVTQRTGITAGELARDAGISPAAVTNVIDSLEARGWLIRSADPADRRRTILRADERAGQELFPYYAAMYEHFMGELNAMSVAELERLSGFFERSNAFVEREIERVSEGD